MAAILNIAKSGGSINISGCFHQHFEIVWYQVHLCQISCFCPAVKMYGLFWHYEPSLTYPWPIKDATYSRCWPTKMLPIDSWPTRMLHIDPCWPTRMLPINPCWLTRMLPIDPWWPTRMLPINPCWPTRMLPIDTCWHTWMLPIDPCWHTWMLPIDRCWHTWMLEW